MKVTITLNGTTENPFAKYGLKCNPFPAIADASPRYDYANKLISRLAMPITDKAELKSLMQGCSEDLIELCLSKFTPGEIVRFRIEFPD